jgi:hypothetical protein
MSPQTRALADSQARLYEQDYALWLLEELEDLERSERRALTSNLIVMLIHLRLEHAL